MPSCVALAVGLDLEAGAGCSCLCFPKLHGLLKSGADGDGSAHCGRGL